MIFVKTYKMELSNCILLSFSAVVIIAYYLSPFELKIDEEED